MPQAKFHPGNTDDGLGVGGRVHFAAGGGIDLGIGRKRVGLGSRL